MSLRKYMTQSLHLTLLALVATLAGCSLNPFADDEPAPAAPVVDRTGSAPSGSSSLDPNAAARSTQQSSARMQPVAQEPRRVPLSSTAPDEYVVQDGDTLWDIASTFLQDPWYWPEVWYVNPQVENPHLIYPGDVLALVIIDGRERVTNVRASTFRLSPEARVTPLTETVQSIPYESVSAFLMSGTVLERGEAETLPYVLSSQDNHLVAAAGNDIYVRGGVAQTTGTRYSIVKVGDELVDPDDGRSVGYQGIFIGEGVLARGGDPATVSLTDTNRETMAGDRLVPESVDIPLNFFPKPPNSNVDGRIISVVDGVSRIGQYQVIVINRGTRHGLAPGDVLTVWQAGAQVRDRFAGGTTRVSGGELVTLPDEEAGTVMIFKVYDRIGYGLVMEATSEIRVLDAVRNPS